MRKRAQAIRTALLLIGVVVLLNVLGQKIGFRWDLSDDKRYTLSKATLDLLDRLPEAVTITAYFSENMPAELERGKREFKDLLVEYSERSDGNVVFEFIDPKNDPVAEKEANQNGIRSLMAQTLEKDKAEQMVVYMGALVKMGEQQVGLPVIQANSPMEWALSSAIQQVAVVDKPTLGIVQGHGEPSMNTIPQTLQELNVTYSVEHFSFSDTLPVYDRFDVLLFVDPKDTLPANHLHWMDDALARGKGIILAYTPVQSDLSNSPVLDMRYTGIENWLAGKGIRIEQGIVADASCGTVSVMQQRGQFNIPMQIPFPYFPLIKSFPEHPISSGLEGVLFQLCAPLSYSGDTALHFAPMLTTSAKSTVLPAPQVIDIQKQWANAEFSKGPQVVGATLEGYFGSRTKARLAVLTNGTFFLNGQGGQMTQVNPDNVNLLVNAVDWVSDETGLIELRTRGATYRPIKELEDSKRDLMKAMNMLVPFLLVVLYGLARAQWRRAQRRRRMQPGHVL